MLNRRRWLIASAHGFTGLIVSPYSRISPLAAAPGGADSTKIVSIVEFSDTGARRGVAKVPMIVKNEDDWRQQLAEEGVT